MNSTTFKAGDRVRCIVAAPRLGLGQEYIVDRIDAGYVYLVGFGQGYFSYRFELAPKVTKKGPFVGFSEALFSPREPKVTKGRFVVISDDDSEGGYGCSCGSTGREHTTLEDALKDARDMAEYAERTYVVFQAIRVVKLKKSIEVEELAA